MRILLSKLIMCRLIIKNQEIENPGCNRRDFLLRHAARDLL